MAMACTQLAESRARCSALEMELEELKDMYEVATFEADERQEM
jgi:hypothetical protein